MKKQDVRINKGVSLFASEWQGLDGLACEHGLSRNGLLSAIAKREILLSQPLEVSASRLLPTVEYLLTLTAGSLPQNLSRALRVWAIIYTMPSLGLSKNPTFARWRRAFFTPSHPVDDCIPEVHDPKCRCALTVTQWLRLAEVNEKQWQQSIQQRLEVPDEDLDQLLDSRLFAVTRRTLAKDLESAKKHATHLGNK